MRTVPLGAEADVGGGIIGGVEVRQSSLTVDHDDDLLTIAQRMPMPVRQRRSLRNGHVAIATLPPNPPA